MGLQERLSKKAHPWLMREAVAAAVGEAEEQEASLKLLTSRIRPHGSRPGLEAIGTVAS